MGNLTKKAVVIPKYIKILLNLGGLGSIIDMLEVFSEKMKIVANKGIEAIIV